MRRSKLRFALVIPALLAAACNQISAHSQAESLPPESGPCPDGTAPAFSRLALFEQAVNWFVRSRNDDASRLLTTLTERIEEHAGLMQIDTDALLPETTRLMSRLSGNQRIRLRIMAVDSPIAKDGFAGMRLGNTVYLPRNVEVRAAPFHLQTIVAHELSHDPFDVLKKHLYRQIAEATETDRAWLDARLELRAHVGAMQRLALVGMEPARVVDYLRAMRPGQLSAEQIDCLIVSATRELKELRLVITLSERLH